VITLPLELDRDTKREIERHYEVLTESTGDGQVGCTPEQLERVVSVLLSHEVMWRCQLAHYALALHRVVQDCDSELSVQVRPAVLAALTYLCNTDDVTPDYTLGAGFLDDAHVMNKCLRIVRRHSPETYRQLLHTVEESC